MAFAGFDLIARLLLVERKDAIPWGVDPAPDLYISHAPTPASDSKARLTVESESVPPSMRSFLPLADVKGAVRSDVTIHKVPADDVPQHTITPLDVLLKLLTSPRAVVCILSTFVYG